MAAFTYTKDEYPQMIGKLMKTTGTYTSSDGGVGGNINTGMTFCVFMRLQANGSSAGTNANTVNETLPVAGSAVTIVTDANEVGIWEAWGI